MHCMLIFALRDLLLCNTQKKEGERMFPNCCDVFAQGLRTRSWTKPGKVPVQRDVGLLITALCNSQCAFLGGPRVARALCVPNKNCKLSKEIESTRGYVGRSTSTRARARTQFVSTGEPPSLCAHVYGVNFLVHIVISLACRKQPTKLFFCRRVCALRTYARAC